MPSPASLARRAALVLALAAAAAPAAAGASVEARASSVRGTLAAAMSRAGSGSGAFVVDADTGRVLFSSRATAARSLASNTKLFTTAAVLARLRPEGTLATEVRGNGLVDLTGVYHGDLYLVGGGDPTFGSRSFARRNYGGGGNVEDLADALAAAGIRSVTGRVYGDESRFDSLRGGPDSGYGVSPDVGPLSALSFNRGLVDVGGSDFQRNPPLIAARALATVLRRDGIPVAGTTRVGRAPLGATVLASEPSPTMTRLARLMDKDSDNFFAEMLVKDLAARAYGRGTTSAGARLAARFARRLGARVRLVDGSGLARADRAAPPQVVRLLLAERRRGAEFPSFQAALPIAGRDGTLRKRMRRGPAHTRCRAKTGTLSSVSALSGYCRARSGHVYVFSILMSRIDVLRARSLQDRMAQAIAGIR